MDKRVTRYITAVKKRIKNDYGEIPEEWSAQLQQLEDLYICYLKAADIQREQNRRVLGHARLCKCDEKSHC